MYYRSLNAYLRETFGCKVYKLALSAGAPVRTAMGHSDRAAAFFATAAENLQPLLRCQSTNSLRRQSSLSQRKPGQMPNTLPIFRIIAIPTRPQIR